MSAVDVDPNSDALELCAPRSEDGWRAALLSRSQNRWAERGSNNPGSKESGNLESGCRAGRAEMGAREANRESFTKQLSAALRRQARHRVKLHSHRIS